MDWTHLDAKTKKWHIWKSGIGNRVNAVGCSVCAGKQIQSGINDLASQYPKLLKQWNFKKNKRIDPSTISPGTEKKVWWNHFVKGTNIKHEWKGSIAARVYQGVGCSICSGHQIQIGINDLKTTHPRLAKEWHSDKNGILTSRLVTRGSHKKVWWRHYSRADKKYHEWTATIQSRAISGQGCAICSGSQIQLGVNDLATTHPHLAKEWHHKKNGKLTPYNVSMGSIKKVWWQHLDTKTGKIHIWISTPNTRTNGKHGCAVCRGLQIQRGVNDLKTTHPRMAKQWHPTLNGELKPWQVTMGSEKRIWWQHLDAKTRKMHIWVASVDKRTSDRSCAICRGLQIQVGVNDLSSLLPDLASQWHPTKNGSLTPEKVTVSSGRKVWWCHLSHSGELHEWRTTINSRSDKRMPSGCSKCSRRGFDPNASAHIYILSAKIKGHLVLHFGISNKVNRRLSKHRNSGFISDPIALIPFSSGLDAKTTEASLTKLMKEYEIPSCSKQGIRFDGSTEAFIIDDLDEDFLEEFQEIVGLVLL